MNLFAFSRVRRYKYFLSVAAILGVFYFQFQSLEATVLADSNPDPIPRAFADSKPLDSFDHINDLPRIDLDNSRNNIILDDDYDPPGHFPASDNDLLMHNNHGSIELDKYDNNIDQSPLASQEVIAQSPLKYFTVVTTGGGYSRTKGKTEYDQYQEVEQPRPEKFPVKNLINLPKIDSSFRPKIQATSFHETLHEKSIRLTRRQFVKDVFKKSWSEYKQYAWGTDELLPLSRKGYDPFLGWSATIVDALDTLHIMGLHDEFKESIDVVKNIHFNGTYRNVIPMFETNIRYLGGLLAAYDLTNGKETILLEQAKNLGELLLRAFDTPNRMPLTFYKWRDNYKDVKYRAGSNSLAAEIGTFTVEFTRLAQLTGEDKYYDAVARITNMFYDYLPNSRIPWLLAQGFDVSGCRNVSLIDRLDVPDQPKSSVYAEKVYAKRPTGSEMRVPRDLESSKSKNLEENDSHLLDLNSTEDTDNQKLSNKPRLLRRALTTIRDIFKALLDPERQVLVDQEGSPSWPRETCSPDDTSIIDSDNRLQLFTLGSTVDSAYEYYMKEYFLLGGSEPKYVEMYNGMVKSAKANLFFRPLVQNNENIIFPGETRLSIDGNRHNTYGLTHLACYIGGMLGLGGKILNQQDDIELAKKLTEACVWAYNSTRTGVMPETLTVRACPGSFDSTEPCVFNFEQQIKKDRMEAEETLRNSPIFKDPMVDSQNKTRWNVQNVYDMPRDYLDMSPTYSLRPEALESVFYMYRITGDRSWQDKGWQMFESIAQATQIMNGTNLEGYASVLDVTDDSGDMSNLMDNSESFWWGETLKYAYLLFEEPDVISLDDYVFNTEAHPFKIPRK